MTDDSSYASINSAIDKLVKRVDGTWIKISSSDLKEFSSSYAKTKTCMNDTISKFKDDTKARSEVSDLYSKNQFITVDKDLGQKNGSFGYQIKGDEAKFKSFAKGLENTTIYKSLHDCDSTFTINADDIDLSKSSSTSDTTVEIWADVWSHKLTELAIKGKDSKTSVSIVINPDYSQKVTVSDPSDSISLSDLKSYVEEFMSALQSSYGQDYNSDSSSSL